MTEGATTIPFNRSLTGYPTALVAWTWFAQNFAVPLTFRQKSFEHFLIPQ